MAIALEFVNVLIRIDAIKEKYEGGWEKFLEDNNGNIGDLCWYDSYLFRDGAMSSGDIEDIITSLEERGLKASRNSKGKRVEWIDLCVVTFGPTLPCKWISMGDDGFSAYLKGTDPGKMMGRNSNKSPK
jgi:hypothetical protein